MATFVSVRAALLTKLQTLTGGGQKIVAVYDRHEPNLSGYPSITFDISDNESDFLTARDNARGISFQVVIWQLVKTKGLDDSTEILDAATDDVISAIENDPSLGGACDWMIPVPGRRIRLQGANGDSVVQLLTVVCKYSTALSF